MKTKKWFANCKAGGRQRMLLPLSACCLAMTAFSCGSAKDEAMMEPNTPNNAAKTVAAYVPGITTDTIKGALFHFLRTAQVKCEVKNVLNATQQIEAEVNDLGGYIEKSELLSVKDYSTRVQFKKDSVLETTFYTAACHITGRVPNHELDSFMRSLSQKAVFVDVRKVSAEDVKLKLLANKLAEDRYDEHNTRLISAKKDSQKLQHQISAEESVLEKQTQADDKRIESLSLADAVNYSEVTIVLYEKQKARAEVLPLPVVPKIYQPSFGQRLLEAFLTGLNILKELFLFLIQIWGIILLGLALYIGIRKLLAYYARHVATKKA